MRKILLGIVILFLAVSVSKKTLAWEGDSTGWCTDENGRNFRCDEGGSSSPSPTTYESPAYTPPRETKEQRRRREAIEMNNKCVQYHNNKEYDKAIPCYEAALNLDPSSLLIQNNLKNTKKLWANDLGIKYWNEENWGKAVSYFKEALSYGRDSTIENNLRKAENQLKFENLAKAEKEQETKVAEAKEKINKMLDNLAVDFDGSKKGAAQSSSSSLEFMDTSQPLFSKGDKYSAVVVAGNPPAKPRVVTPSVSEGSFRKLVNVDKTRKDRESISSLEDRYWVLEDQISKEKDPVKRAELINEQTYIKSQIGVLEITILDRYREEQQNAGREEKDKKIETLLTDSAMDAWSGSYDSSLASLNEALKADPGNKGIQQAINYVNYIKDMEEGRTKGNAAEPILFDALAYGNGDWNKIISNVKKASGDNSDDTAIRDALNIIEGMQSYQRNTGNSEIWARLNKAGNLIDDRDYEGALRILKETHELYPDDAGVRDSMWLMQGVCSGQKSGGKDNTASLAGAGTGTEQKGFLREKSDADKLVSKAMSFITKNDYVSAVPLLKKAHELDPRDMVIRDALNFAKGASCNQYQPKKSASQTNTK